MAAQEEIGLYCLDVGNSVCTIIIYGSKRHAILFDAGGPQDEILRLLRDYSVSYISAIFITHYHKDHYSALLGVIGGYERRVGTLFTVIDKRKSTRTKDVTLRTLQDFLERQLIQKWYGLIVDELSEGKRLSVTECPYSIWCLYPDMPGDAKAGIHGGVNISSAALLLEHGATKILFGGDLQMYGWRRLLDRGVPLTADLFLAPHHGGPQGNEVTPTELLQMVFPDKAGYVFISTRRRHNLPSRDFVEAAANASAAVLCTERATICPAINVEPIYPDFDFHSRRAKNPCAGNIVARITERTIEVLNLAQFTSQFAGSEAPCV